MALIELELLDPPILDQADFGPDMARWTTNIVDIINENFTTLNNAFSSLLAVGQQDIGGGGSGPITVTATDVLPGNFVNVTLASSSNPVTVETVTAGTGDFDVTFSADPGASAIIAYQAFVSEP